MLGGQLFGGGGGAIVQGLLSGGGGELSRGLLSCSHIKELKCAGQKYQMLFI